MFSRIATVSCLLIASWLTSSVEGRKMAPIRLVPRADDYVWTIKWTGPRTCTSWPCGYSYEVSAPTYTGSEGSVPSFDAACRGTVDQPLQACTLASGQVAGTVMATVSGNFSTFETSGVGSGLIDIAATWFDQASGTNRTLTGVTPMQASSANQNTWTLTPRGCPVSDCPGTNTTRSLRRGYVGLEI
ncbi:hypothetical protein SAMD00023353_1000770 [Rosellinia necatrix]|uniref:Uncharacterized protein n=1 Tax=Rosellinia necatrix TaxID=77044 RepID=A0A1W2TBY3_ROSNE|nr:hypothetical protein SAMD00023353_1000770 [Rosellinia necatrix]